MLAHARFVAASGDMGLESPSPHTGSAVAALRKMAHQFAQLAVTPESALRNLAYLGRDLADPDLYGNLREMNRKARSHYEQLVAAAVAASELAPDTPISRLARTIETTLIGSFLTWTIYRDGRAAKWLRRDLDAVLSPYRVRRTRSAANAPSRRATSPRP